MTYKHTLWIDTETRSRNPITLGAYIYAEDSECIMVQYALDDGDVKVWSPSEGHHMPADLTAHLSNPDVQLAFHNVEFDRTNMLAWGWGSRFDLNPRRFLCTMTWARMCRLPGGLDELGRVLGLTEAYSKKAGDALIRLFCIPEADGSFVEPWEQPDRWAEFVEYGVRDIVAMRECARRMPQVFNAAERELYARTLEMNDRGIGVDRELAVKAMNLADRLKAQYKKEGAALAAKAEADRWGSAEEIAAAGQVSVTSQKAILDFIASYGIKLEDARGATLEKFLDSAAAELLPAEVRGLLATRLKANKASVAKYSSVLKGCSSDGRIRGLINFYGAGTGRDAGRRFQPQNLSRPVLLNKNLTMDDAVGIVKSGMVEWHFAEPMQLLSDTVRGVLVPGQGNKFAVADLSSIEGRVLPWLAEEEWMVQYFRDLDTGEVKYDGYELAYATAFGVDPNTVTKAQRTLGKPIDLACLAGDTSVVTSNGIKPIIAVTTEDLLWDGTCWVQHQGVIQKGVRPTVNVDGISVTPDHLIEMNGTWKQAGQLALGSSNLTQALETGLASLRLLDSFGGLAGGFTTCLHSAIAERLNTKSTKSTKQTFLKGRQLGVTYAQSKLPLQPAERNTTSTSASCRTTTTGAGCLTESLPQFNGAIAQPIKNFLLTEAGESLCTSLGELTEAPSSHTLSPCPDGTTLSLKLTEKMSTKATNLATSDSLQEKPTSQTNEKCEACSSESLNSKPVFDILNAGSRNKFTVLTSSGALVVHNCGYGGGTGALITFATLYRIDIDAMARLAHEAADPYLWAECAKQYEWYAEKKMTNGLSEYTWTGCQYIIQAWRNKRALTKALWKNCETAFENAILNPGVHFKMGRDTYAINNGGWVFVQLPSGRMLVYPQAHIADRGGRKQLAFMGVNPFTRKWGQIYTYGGKLTENIDQAVARDCFFWNIPQIETAGYKFVARVHDEAVTEVPDNNLFSGDRLAKLMSTPQSWCLDLPLNAVGEDLTRYQK